MSSIRCKLTAFIYFFSVLTISIVHFVPLLLVGHGSNSVEKNTLFVIGWYLACFVISVPFLCEHVVDLVIAFYLPKYGETTWTKNSFLGQFSLLVVPLLSFIIVCVSRYHTVSSYVVHSLTAFSHSLIVCGIFSQLIDYKTDNISNAILYLTAVCCILSQACLTQSTVNNADILLQISLVFGVICLCSQLYSTYQWLTPHKDHTNIASSTSHTVHLFILSIYLAIRVVFLAILVASPTSYFDVNQQLVARVAVLIAIYLMCALLNGRLLRGVVMTLNHEMETKKSFIRYISHEIRSPLSTTSLGLDYLLGQFATNPQLTLPEVLEVVRDAKVTCEIATSTLNDLLMFDKMETGMLKPAKVECNARDFVLKCVRPFQLQAQVHDVSLACLTDGLPDDVQEQCESNILLCVDPMKMEQVVRNFLTNALKFTPRDGTIHVKMVVVERPLPDATSSKNQAKKRSATVHAGLPPPMQLMLRVEVVDNGPGISAENLPKLFGQYVQFDANTLQGGKGSGLGLWLSKAIVEIHGGVIGATSPGPGLGCTFFMELPCINVDPDLAAVEEVDVRSAESVLNTTRSPVSIKRKVSPHSDSPTSSDESVADKDREMSKTFSMSSTKTEVNGLITSIKNSRDFGVTSAGKVVRLPPLSSSINQKISPAAAPPPAVEKSGRAFLRNIARILPQPSPSNSSPPLSVKPQETNSESSSVSIRRYDEEGRSVRSLVNSVNSILSVTDLKVLIVDDSALARKMVERSIAGVCRVCHQANNGQEALQMVIESLIVQGGKVDIEQPPDPPYDVILMDYYMPVLSGPQAVRQIRDAGFQGVILGVTANSSGKEHDNMITAGADRVLVKPFNVEAFKQIVAELRSGATIR